ncbi:nucleotidyltransferase family protein [Pedobacter sp. SL55]|uniref:nucleotidyltransferase family protein n=1 Tax=Pedobacter sp. SL55 TaxID=2995161 RepID=UPI0022716B53|nr:nucleotidyltransferase family protein [Pedobacter sp. SL55]WAC41934.1 nucleotidyltransferase family protein [Pedobacter sp. SL55]
MELLKKEQILQELTARSSALAAFGVEQIGLFGSFVRDEATQESDIDLLVEIKKEFKTFRNFLALNYYLEEIFNRKVELITTQSLSPYIGPHILKTVEYASIAN